MFFNVNYIQEWLISSSEAIYAANSILNQSEAGNDLTVIVADHKQQRLPEYSTFYFLNFMIILGGINERKIIIIFIYSSS